MESWSQLFRCSVSTGARIGRPKFSVELGFKAPDAKAKAKAFASLREAAKQLSLKWDEQ